MIWIVAALAALAVAGCNLGWSRRYRAICRSMDSLKAEAAEARRAMQSGRDQERAELQTLFNSMSDGVLVLDRNDRIALLNRACEDQFQLLTDVRGRTIPEALRRTDLAEIARRLRSAGPSESAEVELAGPPLRILEVHAATVFDRDRKPAGTVVVLHDVTRIRALESIRRDFVANVSHEIRTPLSIIRGGVETLLDGARNDPVASERFLQSIGRHTVRLSHLLDDLLVLSRLESGVIEFHPVAVGLRGLVDALLAEFAGRAAGRKVTLCNEIPAGLMAWADPDRVEQVLVNLMDNAIKYGREGGRVLVGARAAPGSRVQVWVRDDGPGIPAESRERVFERFYRVDKARSRDSGGTGLGLSIVKHIVQSMGGEVWCESVLGEGSTFFFSLPAGQPLDPGSGKGLEGSAVSGGG